MNITNAPHSPAPATELPTLPTLEKNRASGPWEILGEPFDSLRRDVRERFALAVKSKSAFDSALKTLPQARNEDAQALTQAAINGDTDDPGRVHELKALKEIHTAHRLAEGATLASNQAQHALAAAIRGESGIAAIENLEDRITPAQKKLSEQAAAAIATIDEISDYGQLIEAITATRKGTHYGAIANASPRITDVAGHGGQPVSPVLVLQQLVNGYEPRIER